MSMPRQCWVPYITLNTCITMNCCLELINIVFVSRLWSWSKTSIYVWILPDNHDWPIISVNILNKISQFEISIYPLQLQSFEKFVFRFTFGNQIQDLAGYLNGHDSISNYSFPIHVKTSFRLISTCQMKIYNLVRAVLFWEVCL
jgi:hypothetical protein